MIICGIHYWTYNWDCNGVTAVSRWWYWSFLCTWIVFMHVVSLLCLPQAGGLCQVCAVYVEHTVDKFALSFGYLLFLIVLWKQADDWEECAFHAGGKLLICLILQAKIWAAQQNIISCVSFSSAPGCSHGNVFLLRESDGSVRAVSYLDMKAREMEEVGEKGKRRGRAPLGMMVPEFCTAASWI